MQMLLMTTCLMVSVTADTTGGLTLKERQKLVKDQLKDINNKVSDLERNDAPEVGEMSFHACMAHVAYGDYETVRSGTTLLNKEATKAWYQTEDGSYVMALRGNELGTDDIFDVNDIMDGKIPERVLSFFTELVSFAYALDPKEIKAGRHVRIKDSVSKDIWEVEYRGKNDDGIEELSIKNTNPDVFKIDSYDGEKLSVRKENVKPSELELVHEPLKIYLDGHSMGGFCAAILVSAIHWKRALQKGFFATKQTQNPHFRRAFQTVLSRLDKGELEICCYGFNTFTGERMKEETCKKLWDFVKDSDSPEVIPVPKGKIRYHFYNIHGDSLSRELAKNLDLPNKVTTFNGNGKEFHCFSYNASKSCMFLEWKPFPSARKDPKWINASKQEKACTIQFHSISHFLSPADYLGLEKGLLYGYNKLAEDAKNKVNDNDASPVLYTNDDWKKIAKRFPKFPAIKKKKVIRTNKEKEEVSVKVMKRLFSDVIDKAKRDAEDKTKKGTVDTIVEVCAPKSATAA